MSSAIRVSQLTHRYGTRAALDQFSLDVGRGEIFSLLGPNGSGKTTLFRILTTLLPLQQGDIEIFGVPLRDNAMRIRQMIGAVFQTPSIDGKLTVLENLGCQATLCGLHGAERTTRVRLALTQLGIQDRAQDLAETLSGGLQRRVDLARGLLREPALLLLDEPTTALDPAARADIWRYLEHVRKERGVTIVFTTHLLEEADRADRIAILDEGKLVACDTGEALKTSVGGDVISIEATNDAEELGVQIGTAWREVTVQVVDGILRMECDAGHTWVPRLMERFPDRIRSVTLGKPTLEDVFIRMTGHRFWQAQA